MKRFRIGRIDVAMRGIAPAAARAAAQELGAAIVRQMRADESGPQMNNTQINAETGLARPQMKRRWTQIATADDTAASPASATGLADRVARQVVRRIER